MTIVAMTKAKKKMMTSVPKKMKRQRLKPKPIVAGSLQTLHLVEVYE
jgi:hypothetical protein